jgi:hypothetical protein
MVIALLSFRLVVFSLATEQVSGRHQDQVNSGR